MLKLPDRDEQADVLKSFALAHESQAQRGYLLAELQRELGAEALGSAKWREDYSDALVGFETLAFDFERRHRYLPHTADSAPWKDFVWPSFRLRRGLLTATRHEDKGVSEDLFFEVVSGLVAHRIPEVRMQLKSVGLTWSPKSESLEWDVLLEQELQRIFLLLARKDGGHADLTDASTAIHRLHRLQRVKESEFALASSGDLDLAAVRVLALYNAVRACEIAHHFLTTGRSLENEPISEMGARDDIDAFVSDARDILSGVDARLRIKVWRLRFGLHALIENSMYALQLPRSVDALVASLATRSDRPILDSWFPQREAIYSGSLLDPTRSAVVVSLPTSSGKTMLAEMAIAQSLADGGERVVYTAPTRALVNQVARNLKRDLGVDVRIASPAYELDELEDEILNDDFQVLVTTPEKFDLLFRIGHASVRDVSLVIVDEAHNLGCGERGARLELLLSSLRRERRCRFLLLTPFAKNANDLATWLGGQRGASVHVDWRPNDRMVAVAYAASKKGEPYLKLETTASAHGDFPDGVKVSLGALKDASPSRQELAVLSAVRLAKVKRAGVLLLASSVLKAEQMATSAANQMARLTLRKDAQTVAAYLDTEAGSPHPMRQLLEHGVVYHHAGLSPEGRYLVERLVEEQAASVVCATTTLAQGVHFPLSAAVIEGTHRTKAWKDTVGETHFAKEPIPADEFWNIAGRVGRAMEDPMGTIVFATTGSGTRKTVRKYLQADANEVASSLLQVLSALKADEYLDLTSTKSLWRFKELSSFVQYVLHAVAVSGVAATRRDIDALVRGSLVYQMALRESPHLAERLTRLAKEYLETVVHEKGDSIGWYSKMADGTGFSSGSVDLVYKRLADTVSADQWVPDEVFYRADEPSDVLVRVVDALSRIPEVRLGDRESEQEFNPRRVACITTDWVNGRSLNDLAVKFYGGDLSKATKHVHGVIAPLMPWGLRAVHRVLARSAAPVASADVVPAMAMYGVRSREAIGLRMIGVPRMAAEGLAAAARRERVDARNLKSWLQQAPSANWDRSMPAGSRLDGVTCSLVWRVMEGIEPWERLRE